MREQGYTDEEICAAIKQYVPDLDCCGGECDCDRLKVGVALAVTALSLAVAVVLRRRAALTAARDAIARARESSAAAVRRQMQEADDLLREEIRQDELAEVQYRKALDVMKQLEQDAFGDAGIVIIKPPA